MMSSPACLGENAIDWENSKVFTYCGNCKGIRELIDRYNELKRSYESSVKLNELLVQKIAALERRQSNPESESYLLLPRWNEKKERAAFQNFMTNISRSPGSTDCRNRSEPRLRNLTAPSRIYESQ